MPTLLSSLLLALLPVLPQAGAGGQFLTVEEALELAFPDCAIERRTCYLSEAEERRVQELAGCEGAGRVVRPYVATREGRPVGTAYFDAHRVRTKKEVLMVVLDPAQRIARVEVLAFAEPIEYLPRGSFYAQFHGKRQGDPLEVGRGVRGVTGATLSARAATEAARRTLAVQRVLAEREPPPEPEPEPEPVPEAARPPAAARR